ncbi:MAG: hypothetical protein GY810_16305 [Aureispira sp.]|nr:hypothetical protein [Aureispira sp.]
MKKHLKQQELNKIKQLLETADKDNWELAKQLLEGAVDLNPSFVTYLFCRAYLNNDERNRTPLRQLLKSCNKELANLTKSGFTYLLFSSGERDLKVDRAAFYDAMQKVLAHPSIKARSIFAVFNQNRHTVYKSQELPTLVQLLAIEHGFFKKLESIREIDIPYINVFPKGLETLPNLTKISSYSARFKTFPEHFKLLKSLVRFYFHGLPLDESLLKADTFKLPNLREISFAYCKIKGEVAFWEALSSCESLEYLSLPFNKFSTISDSIKKLTTLKTLNISQNKLLHSSDISIEVFQLPKLQKLILNFYPKHQEELKALAKKYNPSLQIDFYSPPSYPENIPAYARDDG